MQRRPNRVYVVEFMRDAADPEAPPSHKIQRFIAQGETPCKAKAHGFSQLETKLKAEAALPQSGWRLFRQTQLPMPNV